MLIKYFREKIKDIMWLVSGDDVDYGELPRNEVYQHKKGRKRNEEMREITEEMMELNEVSVSAITGGAVKLTQDDEGGYGWDEVNVKMLVRSSELTEEDKEEILGYKNRKGECVFSEVHFGLAKRVKGEWAMGKGRSKIVEDLKGKVKGANDGYVGKLISCFNSAAIKRKAKVRKKEDVSVKNEQIIINH